MTVDDVSIAPGWYADPAIAGRLRWWSGAGWTDQVVPIPTSGPVAAPAQISSFPSRREARAAELEGAWSPAVPVRLQDDETVADSPTTAAVASSRGIGSDSWIAGQTLWHPPTEPATWNTPAAWQLAFIPLVAFAASLAYTFIGPMFGLERRYAFGIAITALVISIRIAKGDRAELARLGLSDPPSINWLILGPAVYLGIRLRRVSRVGGRSVAPFWVALGTTVMQLGIVALSVGLLTAAAVLEAVSTPSASDVATAVQEELVAAGYAVTVSCPDADYVDGASVTCALADPAGVLSSVDVVIRDTGSGLGFLVTGAR